MALRQAARQQLNQCEEFVKLDLKLSAILEGKGQPAEAAERLAIAQLCQQSFKKLYAASAGGYAEVFEAQPEFTKDPRTGHRYKAARAAAMAGCGQGKDADKLDTKDHIRLRNQARAWLRSDLEAWAKLADQGKADDRAAAVKTLHHWQTDPDLAGIRDPQPLAKLPESEQETCRKLWADVAVLVKRIQESKK